MAHRLRSLLALIIYLLLIALMLAGCGYSRYMVPVPVPYWSAAS